VKNLHDLLAKLAWDFSPEQLDHLFECFQVRPLPGRPGVLYFLIYVFETPQTLGVCKQGCNFDYPKCNVCDDTTLLLT